jgi:tetratricopeptide (TPR) repeat protein
VAVLEGALHEVRSPRPALPAPAAVARWQRQRIRAARAALVAVVAAIAVAWVLWAYLGSSSRLAVGLSPSDRHLDELARAATRSRSALQAFRAGEAERRAGNDTNALESYRKAVHEDPQFSTAWYRIATVARDDEPGLARDAIQAALKAASPLPERERNVLHAQDAADRGRIDDAITLYGRVVAANPDDLEALHNLGDLRFVFAPVRGWPLDEASELMRRVLEQDPFDVAAIRSRVDAAQMQGERGVVLSLTDRFLEKARGAPLDLRWAHAWAAGDAAGRDAEIEKAVVDDKLDEQRALFLRAAFAEPAMTDAARLAQRLMDAAHSPSRRAFWMSALAMVDLARGSPSKARARMREARALADGGTLPLFAAWMETFDFVHPGKADLEVARAAAKLIKNDQIPTFEPLRLYLEGALAARALDAGSAEKAAAALESLEASDATTLGKDLAKGVRARLLAYAGRPAEALALLQGQELRISNRDVNLFSRISEQRLRADLLDRAGRPGDAAKWEVLAFGTPLELPLVAPVHLHLCELLVELGDKSAAASNARIALAVWSNPDEEMRDEVARARKCLARSGSN